MQTGRRLFISGTNCQRKNFTGASIQADASLLRQSVMNVQFLTSIFFCMAYLRQSILLFQYYESLYCLCCIFTFYLLYLNFQQGNQPNNN